MLRTILILAAASLLCSVAYAQTKIGDNVLDIDSASILELESSSRGFLPSRMTSAQRDAQTQWDQAHIIYNTTENCLQIYTGSLWLCLQQGTPMDSSIYKQNGTLRSDRTVTMNGSDLTFDGSRDIIITDDGKLGIGDLSPDALLDVEGGTVRLSDYGSGVNSGQRTFLLGVDGDGDVITVDTSSVGTDDQTIDALFIQNDTLFISLEDDGVSDLFVNLAPYLDGDTDWLAFGGSKADNILDTIYTFGNVGINTSSPGASLHVVDQADTYAGPWAIIEGGGGVFPNTALQLYDKGTGANNQNIIEFAHRVSGNPVALATIRSHSDAADHVNGADLILETSNDNSGTLNTNQLYLKNNGRIGIGTSTPDEDLHIAGDMRLDGAFEDKDGDAGSSGNVLTSTVTGTDWVAASTIGSDDQMVDTFSINGSDELLISLENDGEAAQKVDLSPYLDDQTVSITGAGITTVAGTYPSFTINSTEVDGSITNEKIINFAYTASTGRLRIIENGLFYDATLALMSPATGVANGVRGLVPRALTGQQTYLLTGAGTWVDPTTLSSPNIYTADGTLGANRTVGLSTFNLIFDGTTDVIIESGGDVGIGTTNPDAKLHVSGGTSSVELLLEADTDNVTETDQPKLTFKQDGGTIEGHLGFTDGDNILRLSNESNNKLEFQTDATTRVTIAGNGAVGIGTITPDELLHIAGNMRLDGAFEDKDGDAGSSGDVLTSTVTGTDWVAASTIGTDNQTIDIFNINGSDELELSLERDGVSTQTVDLSPYLDDQTVSIMGAGINIVTGTYPNFTITATEVDGSITNETITNFTYTAASGQLRIIENAINFLDTIAVMSGASGVSAGIRGLVPDALAGEQAYLLTAAGTWVDPSSLSGVNIYNANGTLDANRTVGLSTFDLVFDGTSDIIFESDGDVGIGTTTPGARLEVAGGSVIFDEYGVGTHADTSANYIIATDTSGNVVELNTAKNTRWFYPPAVVIDASDLDTAATLDLYDNYVKQFTGNGSTTLISSDGAFGEVPYYDVDELEYYITYYDDTILANVSIDANGEMTYDIIAVPFDNYTVINVVFVIK